MASSVVRSRFMSILRLAPQSTLAFLVAFDLGLLALCQESRTGDPSVAGPANAVVQLLAIGPAGQEMNRECAATGFLVNEEGYILTNAHVVEDARHCLAASSGAKIMAKLARPGARTAAAVSCDVVGVADLRDLAVLKPERSLPAEGPPSFARLATAEAAEGAPVVAIGHSGFAWQPTPQKGRVIGRRALALSERSAEKSQVIILDMPLQPGASGSPVCLELGGVIAIVERQNPTRPSETVAVPISYAIELLERLHVRWHAAP